MLLTRALSRAGRAHIRPPRPSALPVGAATLTRCMATPAQPPPSTSTPAQQSSSDAVPSSASASDADGGARFEELTRSPLSQPSRNAAGGLNIVPPRPRGGSSTTHAPRPDDPSMQAMITRMDQFQVTSSSVPMAPVTGKGAAALKARPQKGGQPIHAQRPVPQRGKLTPLQMHRILSSMQQDPASWPASRVASFYSLDESSVSLLNDHLGLPFVEADPEQRGLWEGTIGESTGDMIQRSLGQATEKAHILGEHIRIEKDHQRKEGANTTTPAGARR